MKGVYEQTVRVGFIRTCLRYIEDPNRNMLARILLAISPLLIVWIISPLDIIPEIILGPLGLADDGAIILSLFFIMRFANSFYAEKRYMNPAKRLAEGDNEHSGDNERPQSP